MLLLLLLYTLVWGTVWGIIPLREIRTYPLSLLPFPTMNKLASPPYPPIWLQYNFRRMSNRCLYYYNHANTADSHNMCIYIYIYIFITSCFLQNLFFSGDGFSFIYASLIQLFSSACLNLFLGCQNILTIFLIVSFEETSESLIWYSLN